MSAFVFKPYRVVEIDFTSVRDVQTVINAQPNKARFTLSTPRVVEIEYLSYQPEVTDTSLRIVAGGDFRVTSDGSFRSVRV